MKIQINIISKNINLSDEEESDDDKNIKFIYISDKKLNPTDDSDIDDEDNDNELKIERKTRRTDILIRNNIIQDKHSDNLSRKQIDNNNNNTSGNNQDGDFKDELYDNNNKNNKLSIFISNKRLRSLFLFQSTLFLTNTIIYRIKFINSFSIILSIPSASKAGKKIQRLNYSFLINNTKIRESSRDPRHFPRDISFTSTFISDIRRYIEQRGGPITRNN
jgi:hypothetical protein